MTRSLLGALGRAVREGRRDEARSLTQSLLDEGLSAKALVDRALVPAMGEVGDLFAGGTYFIPEVLLSARAMKEALAVLEPRLVGHASVHRGVVVIGTVKDDLHDIGKNIVGTMLTGAGFRVVDLGVDVRPARFLEAAEQEQAAVVGLSALLTTTVRAMEATVALLHHELTAKTLVGGASVTEAVARAIGADGYAADASGAVTEARRLAATA